MLKLIKQTSFLFFAALFLVVFFPGYAKIQELRQKNKELELNIRKLQRDNLAMRQERDKMEKDPDYLERVGRAQLGIVKKGETVYKLVPEQEKK